MKAATTSSITTLTLLAVLGVDYFLATLFASDSKEVWTWFLVLVFVPLLFIAKTATIRFFLWKFYLKKSSIKHYLDLFQSQKWPRWGFCSDAEDYLSDAIEDTTEKIEVRINAARLHGTLRAYAESQQIVSYFVMNSAIKEAARQHEKTIYKSNGEVYS
jgi:hypothetical protein